MNLTSASGATRLTKTEHTESLSETGEMWFNSVAGYVPAQYVTNAVSAYNSVQAKTDSLGTVEAVPLPSQGSIAIDA